MRDRQFHGLIQLSFAVGGDRQCSQSPDSRDRRLTWNYGPSFGRQQGVSHLVMPDLGHDSAGNPQTLQSRSGFVCAVTCNQPPNRHRGIKHEPAQNR